MPTSLLWCGSTAHHAIGRGRWLRFLSSPTATSFSTRHRSSGRPPLARCRRGCPRADTERSPTRACSPDADIQRIAAWADAGAPEGDSRHQRQPPAWTDDWQLGKPDLVVELREPYTLEPGTADEFRNFVLPLPLTSTAFVRGIEVRPGNAHVVHHATIGIDRTRASRLLDDADPGPGYDGMFSSGAHSPDSHALGWTPGMTPRLDPPGIAWRLDPGSDLVVQLHMMRAHVHEPETVRPAVAFYFSPAAPDRESIDFRLGSKTIDIPAGDSAYEVTDTYELPVDVQLLSIYPHAHYLAKEMKVSAALPGDRTEQLLWIKRWDFRWQDQYHYAAPVSLPRGTRITMAYTYDNSASNPANPSRPPVRVQYGPQSSDEMGDLWLRFVAASRRRHRHACTVIRRERATEGHRARRTRARGESRRRTVAGPAWCLVCRGGQS